MLFTRCPDCETTFRVTASALLQAAGQVRCGRCDAVFVADDEFGAAAAATAADRDEQSSADAAAPGDRIFSVDSMGTVSPAYPNAEAAPDQEPDFDPDHAPVPEARLEAGQEADVAPGSAAVPEPGSAPPEADAALEATASEQAEQEIDQWAEFFAQAPGPQDETGRDREIRAIAAELDKAEALLVEVSGSESSRDSAEDETEDEAEEPSSDDTFDDVPDDDELGSRLAALAEAAQEPEVLQRRSRVWTAAAVVLALVLAAQVTHYFRAELATQPVVGPLLRDAYARIGIELVPRWDLSQYEILDWVASAEPSGSDAGTMKITARIRNNGPAEQPYPSLQLQLKDRWDQTVGSRVFAPPEYLPVNHVVSGLMAVGTTVPAELDLVDRAQDAYGFELDVCIDAPSGGLTCVADAVFR